MRSAIPAVIAATLVTSAAFAGDHYDKEATNIVLARAARQVHDNCGFATDEDGKRNGPWGKTSVNIMLGHNGHSKEVTVPEPFAGKPTGNCVLKAFSSLSFPPWNGPDEAVDQAIEIPRPK